MSAKLLKFDIYEDFYEDEFDCVEDYHRHHNDSDEDDDDNEEED